MYFGLPTSPSNLQPLLPPVGAVSLLLASPGHTRCSSRSRIILPTPVRSTVVAVELRHSTLVRSLVAAVVRRHSRRTPVPGVHQAGQFDSRSRQVPRHAYRR